MAQGSVFLWEKFEKKKKTLTVLVYALAAALVLYVVNYPYDSYTSASQRQLPIYCVQRD